RLVILGWAPVSHRKIIPIIEYARPPRTIRLARRHNMTSGILLNTGDGVLTPTKCPGCFNAIHPPSPFAVLQDRLSVRRRWSALSGLRNRFKHLTRKTGS